MGQLVASAAFLRGFFYFMENLNKSLLEEFANLYSALEDYIRIKEFINEDLPYVAVINAMRSHNEKFKNKPENHDYKDGFVDGVMFMAKKIKK